jgi:hypothetical protein
MRRWKSWKIASNRQDYKKKRNRFVFIQKLQWAATLLKNINWMWSKPTNNSQIWRRKKRRLRQKWRNCFNKNSKWSSNIYSSNKRYSGKQFSNNNSWLISGVESSSLNSKIKKGSIGLATKESKLSAWRTANRDLIVESTAVYKKVNKWYWKKKPKSPHCEQKQSSMSSSWLLWMSPTSSSKCGH